MNIPNIVMMKVFFARKLSNAFMTVTEGKMVTMRKKMLYGKLNCIYSCIWGVNNFICTREFTDICAGT